MPSVKLLQRRTPEPTSHRGPPQATLCLLRLALPAAAVAELRTQSGSLDEDILRLFIETVGLYPIGAFVELASSKLATGINEDREGQLRSVIQAFFSLVRSEHILPCSITLADQVACEQIVGGADLAGVELPDDALLRELVFLSACRALEVAGGDVAEQELTE